MTIYERGWILRYRPPLEAASRKVTLLLHGWTGDETVMWVFARSLPADTWVLAPRGPFKAPTGYGWNTVDRLSGQRYSDYARSAQMLVEQLSFWRQRFRLPDTPVDLMGFSQGAAMSYSLLIGYTDQVGKTAALAGFLPAGAEEEIYAGQMDGKQVFIAHGSRDDTVPVQAARRAAEALERAGAGVIYCEDDVGHKLGASCNRGLTTFFQPDIT